MSIVASFQQKFAVTVAVLALLTVIAIGVLAGGSCAAIDEYGVCVGPWNGPTIEGLGG